MIFFKKRTDPRVQHLGDWLIDAFKAEAGWDELGAEITVADDAVTGLLWVRYGPQRFDHTGEFTQGCDEERLLSELATEQNWSHATLHVIANWKKGTSTVTLLPG